MYREDLSKYITKCRIVKVPDTVNEQDELIRAIRFALWHKRGAELQTLISFCCLSETDIIARKSFFLELSYFLSRLAILIPGLAKIDNIKYIAEDMVDGKEPQLLVAGKRLLQISEACADKEKIIYGKALMPRIESFSAEQLESFKKTPVEFLKKVLEENWEFDSDASYLLAAAIEILLLDPEDKCIAEPVLVRSVKTVTTKDEFFKYFYNYVFERLVKSNENKWALIFKQIFSAEPKAGSGPTIAGEGAAAPPQVTVVSAATPPSPPSPATPLSPASQTSAPVSGASLSRVAPPFLGHPAQKSLVVSEPLTPAIELEISSINALLGVKNYSGALTKAEALFNDNKNVAAVNLLLGSICAAQGKYLRAFAYLSRAYNRAPQDAKILSELAKTYWKCYCPFQTDLFMAKLKETEEYKAAPGEYYVGSELLLKSDDSETEVLLNSHSAGRCPVHLKNIRPGKTIIIWRLLNGKQKTLSFVLEDSVIGDFRYHPDTDTVSEEISRDGVLMVFTERGACEITEVIGDFLVNSPAELPDYEPEACQ